MLFHRLLLFPCASPGHTRRNHRSGILGVLCDRLVQTTMDIFYSQRDTPFCGFEGARLEILSEDLLCYCNAFCVSRWGRKRTALSLGS